MIDGNNGKSLSEDNDNALVQITQHEQTNYDDGPFEEIQVPHDMSKSYLADIDDDDNESSNANEEQIKIPYYCTNISIKIGKRYTPHKPF